MADKYLYIGGPADGRTLPATGEETFTIQDPIDLDPTLLKPGQPPDKAIPVTEYVYERRDFYGDHGIVHRVYFWPEHNGQRVEDALIAGYRLPRTSETNEPGQQ